MLICLLLHFHALFIVLFPMPWEYKTFSLMKGKLNGRLQMICSSADEQKFYGGGMVYMRVFVILGDTSLYPTWMSSMS